MFRVDRFDTILPPGQGAIMAVGASKPTSVTDKDGIFSVKTKITVTHQQDNKSATTKFSINAYSGFDSAVSASISIGVLLPALNACFKVNVVTFTYCPFIFDYLCVFWHLLDSTTYLQVMVL
ncbi:uncharacterized protein [Rutidosis leptorrhynchoides]|uniref:uncharacterized protein isoform X2 n=1 Tax=Rutidosis leptorrhynchoides TaxID=125765 RepID=UPI003A994006